MSISELACAYACLILLDDGIAITADKIATLVKAANISVVGYFPSLYCKVCETGLGKDLLSKIKRGGGAAVAVRAEPGARAAAVETLEDSEEEESEDSDESTFSLFD